MNEVRRRGPIAAFFTGLWNAMNFTRRLVFNVLFFVLLLALLYALFSGGGLKPLGERTTLVIAPEGRLVEQFRKQATRRQSRECAPWGRPPGLPSRAEHDRPTSGRRWSLACSSGRNGTADTNAAFFGRSFGRGRAHTKAEKLARRVTFEVELTLDRQAGGLSYRARRLCVPVTQASWPAL